MDEIPEIPELYEMETLEQIRILADELRVRIMDALIAEPLTATQVADQLGQPPPKIHYHVRELERVGLVTLVATREKGGILEKYYRAVARNFTAPSSLLRRVPPDEVAAATGEVLRLLTQGFQRSFVRGLRERHGESVGEPEEEGSLGLGLSISHLWMTQEEWRQLESRLAEVLKPYEQRRGSDDERERTFAWIGYETETAAEDVEATPEPPAPPTIPPKIHRSVLAGVVTYSRQDLERVVARGERLDLHLLGACAFADDVSAALVDRAIARFRIRGVLSASPAVRAALKRKEDAQG